MPRVRRAGWGPAFPCWTGRDGDAAGCPPGTPPTGWMIRGTRPTLDVVPEPDRSRQFDDELVGLDPEDPEARAFAAHLDRMQRERPAFTVEGYLAGVSEFADSANRAVGERRWGAVVVVVLLLAVVAYLMWDAFTFVVTTWL